MSGFSGEDLSGCCSVWCFLLKLYSGTAEETSDLPDQRWAGTQGSGCVQCSLGVWLILLWAGWIVYGDEVKRALMVHLPQRARNMDSGRRELQQGALYLPPKTLRSSPPKPNTWTRSSERQLRPSSIPATWTCGVACLEQVMETCYSVCVGTEKSSLLGHTTVTWAFLWVTDSVVIDSQQTMGCGHV